MILIYRKVSTIKPVAKLAAKSAQRIRTIIGIKSRIERDAIVDLFMPLPTGKSAFHRMPSFPTSVIDSPAERLLSESYLDAYVVPESCLGRSGIATASQAESLRLWIKQHLAANGVCDISEVSVVFEPRLTLDRKGRPKLA